MESLPHNEGADTLSFAIDPSWRLCDEFLEPSEILDPRDRTCVPTQGTDCKFQNQDGEYLQLIQPPTAPSSATAKSGRPKTAKTVKGPTAHTLVEASVEEGEATSGQEEETPEDLCNQGLISNTELHRQKNKAAQRRFRRRQKAKMQAKAQQLQEMTAAMQRMKLKQQELEARNAILEHLCSLASTHIQDLNENREAYDVQQEMILQETARVYRRGLERPELSISELKAETAHSFIMVVFPAFLGRHQRLLESGGRIPGSPQAIELAETVLQRRQEENRVSAYSHWTLAVYAWNLDEMSQGVQYPGKPFWHQLLASLGLTAQQEEAVVAARRRLLNAIVGIRQRREKLLLDLGLALLQGAPRGSTMEEKELWENLEAERKAVLGFLFTTIDQTLTPIQEAELDVACYPWSPDLWHFANLLAAKHGDDSPDLIRDSAAESSSGASSSLPQYCSAETLALPLLARGAGLQLKRGLASIIIPRDWIAAQLELKRQNISRLKDMTCWNIMRGLYSCSDCPC